RYGSGGDEAVAEGVGGGVGAAARVDLAVEVLDVALDRADADGEDRADLAVAPPGRHEPQHFDLTQGQGEGSVGDREGAGGDGGESVDGAEGGRAGERRARAEGRADVAPFDEVGAGRRDLTQGELQLGEGEQREGALV